MALAAAYFANPRMPIKVSRSRVQHLYKMPRGEFRSRRWALDPSWPQPSPRSVLRSRRPYQARHVWVLFYVCDTDVGVDKGMTRRQSVEPWRGMSSFWARKYGPGADGD